jgi:hypothetical protein
MDSAPPKKQGIAWWKILLGILGVIAILAMLAIGGLVYWLNANKDRLIAMGKEAEETSTAFAATHDQNACVDEGLKKSDACDGIMCEASAKTFVSLCIPKAQATPGFCDDVPAPGEIMKTVHWIQEQCPKHGRRADDQKCSRLMQAVPEGCHRR